MTDTVARRGLDEAAAPGFVNGGGPPSRQRAERIAPASQRSADPRPKARSRAEPVPTTDLSWPAPLALWQAGLAAALDVQAALRGGIAALAAEHWAAAAEEGRDLVETCRALGGEADPERAAALVRAYAERCLDRARDTAARQLDLLAAPGREILEIAARRPLLPAAAPR